MENSYGIGVKNRYALFYNEDEDPLEILKAQEAEREKKKELKLHEKENKGSSGGGGGGGGGTATTKSSGAPQPPATTTLPAGNGGPAKPKAPATNSLAKKSAPNAAKETGLLPGSKQTEPVAPLAKKEENNKFSRNQKPPAERNVKFNTSPRENSQDLVEERKNRRNRDERPSFSTEFRDRDIRTGDGEIRRGGRGGRGGGIGRGGRGRGRGPYDNRGKREYDRQSGSDKSSVKPMDKRDGGGPHNWGTIRDDMEEQLNNTALSDETQEWSEKPEEVTEQTDAPKAEEQPTTETEETKPAEDQPRQMTLDEWKREQEKNRAKPQFNLRKAGEGEDTTQWKKTYILKKKEKEEEEEEESEEDDEEVVKRGRQKQVVEIEINFSDSRRGRGRGRGGRGGIGGGSGGGVGVNSGGGGGGLSGGGPGLGGIGEGMGGGGGGGGRDGGGRGGGGGSGPRGGRMPRSDRGMRPTNKAKSQSAPKVDDENDFPSLQTA